MIADAPKAPRAVGQAAPSPREQRNGKHPTSYVAEAARAELALLGCIILKPDNVRRVGDLTPADFHDPRCREVFASMLSLERADVPIEPMRLEYELQREGKLKAVGGLAFLSDAVAAPIDSDLVEQYANDVRGYATTRAVLVALSEVQASGLVGAALLRAANDRIAAVTAARARPETHVPVDRDIVLSPSFAAVQRTFATGLPYLDRLLAGGFKARQVTCFAAPPGAGKTSLLCAFGRELEQVIPILYVTTEIDPGEVAARLAAPLLDVSVDDICSLRVDPADVAAVLKGRVRILEMDHENAMKRIHEAALSIRAETGQYPAILVDYIQGLCDEGSADIRGQVTAAARDLRKLSQHLDVPIISVSVTSRNYYGNGKKPEGATEDPLYYLAAAKESGGIESQSAVFFYLDVKTETDAEGYRAARLCVAKSRRGQAGFVMVRFKGRTGAFISSSPDEFLAVERQARAKVVTAILEFVKAAKTPPSKEQVRLGVRGFQKVEIGRTVDVLVADGDLVVVTTKRPTGGGGMRSCKGLVCAEDAPPALPLEEDET